MGLILYFKFPFQQRGNSPVDDVGTEYVQAAECVLGLTATLSGQTASQSNT